MIYVLGCEQARLLLRPTIAGGGHRLLLGIRLFRDQMAGKQFSIKRTITINKSHCAKSQFHLHELSLTWLFSRCTAIFCGFSLPWAVGGVLPAIKLHPGSDFIAIFTSFSSSDANTLLLLTDG